MHPTKASETKCRILRQEMNQLILMLTARDTDLFRFDHRFGSQRDHVKRGGFAGETERV